MLSDMADHEGSAGQEYDEEYDNHDDEDDFSGSGGRNYGKTVITFYLIRQFTFFIQTDPDVPVVEPGSPDDHPHSKSNLTPTAAGSALRISSTLVLSSLIVILFKSI